MHDIDIINIILITIVYTIVSMHQCSIMIIRNYTTTGSIIITIPYTRYNISYLISIYILSIFLLLSDSKTFTRICFKKIVYISISVGHSSHFLHARSASLFFTEYFIRSLLLAALLFYIFYELL